MRISALIFLFVLLGMEAFSQTSVGIRGGYASSSFSYRPAANIRNQSTESIAKPTFSLVVEHFNAKNAGVELNLQLITLGFRQLNDADDPLENRTEFDYLKIPFLASFYAGRSGRFQVKIGPHVGYLLGARDVQREFENLSIPEIPTYGGEGDNPKKFMYGINAGAGISKVFGKSALAAEVRFSYDFTNPESQDRIFDMNSTTLELGLSYLFRVRERKEP
ncbi:PorT family protein [Algoriphagus kandeliae]|uniref:PorT family protein n=1 Tax=Algoriphagus kandeliae TaxID=2562278 RepID=A0A4Y9QLJ3_9BACT|nr:porin family protein [Algoriphagus kandeliae]TFV93571.1 PorT family protein [Algoriphagus kandeliae]